MATLDLAAPTVHISPWPDPVIDSLGHDPRSSYVETFWLSILGPSTTWLVRRLVAGLEEHPEGYVLDCTEVARELGVGMRTGKGAPFARSLERACQFGLATSCASGLAVRRRVAPLTRRQAERLPPRLRIAHKHWQERELERPSPADVRDRAHRLALSMAELGEDLSGIERHLHRWRFHPAVAREAAVWAHAEHTGEVARGDDVA